MAMNRLSLDQQATVIAALTEGCSIRATERLTGFHRDTIMRLGVRIGRKCAHLHDATMRDLNVGQIEMDELWAYIGKKQKRLKPDDDPTKGDCYTFIAMDAIGKAIISYRSGKRDWSNTGEFLADLRMRVLGTPMISSDGFVAYEEMMRVTWGESCHYGQIIKNYAGEPPIDAARRYSPGALVGIERKVVTGEMPKFMIGTSHAERQNLSVRMSSRRFTRLTNGFSKKAENHAAAVSLYVAHYNLCRVHETIRQTPAMALGLTDHPWSIAELIDAALRGLPQEPTRYRGRFRVIDGGR
jgi:IS1 family transposase